ncbi:Serine/threonine-protein phosphatase 2A regulatory subunit B'' subunit gamma [Blyttiomyces sp. JEL0837]|nr:Serine/threonine-protein phosphatase 2A regulatory subunit B'' subunit gamma [Blyttiomyces sp. JEL0837]
MNDALLRLKQWNESPSKESIDGSHLKQDDANNQKPAKDPNSPLQKMVRAATVSVFMEQQRENILINEELDVLWEALCERGTEGSDEDKKISYEDFLNIKRALPAKFRRFFKASTYLCFVPDENGYISVLQFFNYVLRKVSLMQARLDLSQYDGDQDGFLTEEELQQYIASLIPTLRLDNVNKSFHKYYVITAARKFIFFLDPLRKGQFMNFDKNHDGRISRAEMGQIANGTYTDIYLDRVFQEYRTYRGELDYCGFLDFVLAMENPQSPEAITYGFKLLDLEGKGYLDEFVVRNLAKTVIDKMTSFGHEPVGIQDFTNEVFDMANPEVKNVITLNDLLKCGVGGTVVTILADSRCFWEYDNRENLEQGNK